MPERESINYNALILRFSGEIGIKSPRVRPRYERSIVKRVCFVLRRCGVPFERVIHTYGRVYVHTDRVWDALNPLLRVFGISSVSPAVATSSDMGGMAELAVQVADATFGEGSSFAVRCRRVGRHPYTSMDVCRELGSAVLKRLPHKRLKVDLTHPEHTINVEVRGEDAYIYMHVYEGAGGLPLGSQGRVVCLLSGGIDSPVACWLAMRRGCLATPIHFDTTPYTSEGETERAMELAKTLQGWMLGLKMRMYVIPHGGNLDEIRENSPEEYTCILCKRLMYRIADRIADMERAEAIITGEIIGEQASQTLRNLRVLDQALTRRRVLRPLLCHDKVEVERLARKIGTYEISAGEAGRCKAAPRRPATRSSADEIARIEENLDVDGMIERSLKSLKIITISQS